MHRGEVWVVDLDPVIGSELRKTRSAVIVSRDEIGVLPVKVVVPITAWRDEFAKADWLVPLEKDSHNGLTKKSTADTVQVRSIIEQRLVKKLGSLSSADLEKIASALKLILTLD
jgi:mRNA interferase MazF